MMAAAADEDEIFVYMGVDQRVLDSVRRLELMSLRTHESVKIFPRRAFKLSC